jgi:hypothetical protein
MSMILPIVTFLPLVGALLCLALPREEEQLHRSVGIGTALVTFFASLFLLSGLEPAKMNHVVDLAWVESLGIRFQLGVDGISVWLVLLTTFLLPIVFLSTWSAITDKVREFVVAFLVLETGMLGAFLALDLFVFYVFWEVMLIPMYFIIGIWGGSERLYASIKFVLYTMVGSLLMLVAILYHGTSRRTRRRGSGRSRSRRPSRSWSCRSRSRSTCSWRSRWRSASRCRCGRCTPGCRCARRGADCWLGHSGQRAAEVWSVWSAAICDADVPAGRRRRSRRIWRSWP